LELDASTGFWSNSDGGIKQENMPNNNINDNNNTINENNNNQW
jgi:hypothetical protein